MAAMKAIERTIKFCDEKIRAGQVKEAAGELAHLEINRVPRALRLPLASICRRAGLPEKGLRLLFRIVHPQRERISATAAELSEYGVLLHKLGANGEALQVLDRADVEEAPEAYLYRAFCYFQDWRFAAAVPLLQKYIGKASDPYQALVGRVNLGLALLSSRELDKADLTITECLRLAGESEHKKLMGNCYWMKAFVSIYRGDLASAKVELGRARTLLNQSAHDLYLIYFGETVVSAFAQNDPAPLIRLRQKAMLDGKWEIAREADEFALQLSFDDTIFNRLYHGSPFPDYRQRLNATFQSPVEKVFLIGEPDRPRLNLKNGSVESLSTGLRPGCQTHRVLEILTRDLYRPIRVAGLFSELFPGEHFDLNSSVHRVHQVLYRARRWAESVDLLLDIDCRNGFYSVASDGALAFEREMDALPADRNESDWQKVTAIAHTKNIFVAKPTREVLGMSRSHFGRLLAWAIKNKRVIAEGEFNSARYRLL